MMYIFKLNKVHTATVRTIFNYEATKNIFLQLPPPKLYQTNPLWHLSKKLVTLYVLHGSIADQQSANI